MNFLKIRQQKSQFYTLHPELNTIAYWGLDHMITSQNDLNTRLVNKTIHTYPISNPTYKKYGSCRPHEDNALVRLEIYAGPEFIVLLPHEFFTEVIDPLHDFGSFSCASSLLFGAPILGKRPFKRLFYQAGLKLGRKIIDDWQMRIWGSCWNRTET